MFPRTKLIAFGFGLTAVLAAAAWGKQSPKGGPATSSSNSADVVTVLGNLDVIDRCDLASLREGVLSKMERHVGHEVKKGDHIALLNSDVARLSREKAEATARNRGEVNKAKAQQEVAMTIYARSLRLAGEGKGFISRDQLDKEKADVTLATAMIEVANDTIKVNESELAIAAQIEKEHEITTPISGIIVEVMKHPGERVGANEPVVKIINIDRLRWSGYVPIEVASRLKVGDNVEVRAEIKDADLEVEKMSLPAKITFISPDTQVVKQTEVQVHATLDNPRPNGEGPHLLRNGLKAVMTIRFGRQPNTVGAR